MIAHPRQWQLYVAIGKTGMEAMLYNPVEEHSLITARIDFDPTTLSVAKAVEDAVYDNPLLLSDFKRVTFLMRDTLHAVIPFDVAADADLLRRVMDQLIGPRDYEPTIDDIPRLGASVAYYIEPQIANFIRRTFAGATFIHPVTGLTRYWHGTGRASGSMTTYVNLRQGAADIVVYSGDRLLTANSYPTPTADDTLYYIMAIREMTSTPAEAPVSVAGDNALRDALMPRLSKCVGRAIPAVFPAAMFLAGGRTALNTPLDLILLPLCV